MKRLNYEESQKVLEALDTIVAASGGTGSISSILRTLEAQLPANLPDSAKIMEQVQGEVAHSIVQSFAGMQEKLEQVAADPIKYAAEMVQDAGIDSNNSAGVQSTT
jgi:hypothetical protein